MTIKISDDELKQLTKDLDSKFPLELREMVYKEMLDNDTIYLLSKCEYPDSTPPRFINPKIVPLNIAREIVGQYYSRFEVAEFDSPDEIPDYFNTDHFGVGVTAAHTTLSSARVTINVDCDFDKAEDITKLRQYFAPLLEENPKFRKGFELIIWGESDADPSEFGGFEDNVWSFVKALRPIVKKAEAKGAKVNISIVCAGGCDRHVRENLFKKEHVWSTRAKEML